MANTTETHHDGGKKMMPQLDPTYFASQLFWLLVVFMVMYVAMAKWVAPRIARVLEHRKNHLGADLSAAELARAEAQGAKGSYEKAYADARQSANTAIAKVQSEIARAAADEQSKLDRKLADEMAKVEEAIACQLRDAKAQMKPLAAELATQMVATVSGLNVPAADIDKAVTAALKE